MGGAGAAAAATAPESPPGIEASEIMRVYSLGPACKTGSGFRNGGSGIANACVAPAGAGGGTADGAAGNPDAAGSGGPWVSGAEAPKNRVNSPARGRLSTSAGAGD